MAEMDHEKRAREFIENAVHRSCSSDHSKDVAPLAVEFKAVAEKAVDNFMAGIGMAAGRGAGKSTKPPPSFKPGMKIGPGHGRDEIETLKTKAQDDPDGSEWWNVESGDTHYFYPDDLDRIIEEHPKFDGIDADGDVVCEYCGVGMILGSRAWLHKDTGYALCKASENPTTSEKPPTPVPKAGAQGESKWKPGQMLIPIRNGLTIFKLEPSRVEDSWMYRFWNGQSWSPIQAWRQFPSFDYEPWPRVGDWVRCLDSPVGVAYKVSKIVGDKIFLGAFSYEYSVEDLEPASPPEQPKVDTRLGWKRFESQEEPKPHKCDDLRYMTMDKKIPADLYKPWPRVGDWVRCKANHGHQNSVFRVEAIISGHVYGGGVAVGACNLEDLEPASPH